MKAISLDKRNGFSPIQKKMGKKGQLAGLFGIIIGIIGGTVGLAFALIFFYLMMSNLNTPTLLPATSQGAQLLNNITANVTAGGNQVSATLPTIFGIGLFVIVIILLGFAWAFAKKQGWVGGGSGQIG